MHILRRAISISGLTAVLFMNGLPLGMCEQSSTDINKNPRIMMDRQIMASDRRVLKTAQGTKDTKRIEAARNKLKRDIRKLNDDKAALKKSMREQKSQ